MSEWEGSAFQKRLRFILGSADAETRCDGLMELLGYMRRAMLASPWQPIETAPKDGTRFIGWPVFGYEGPREIHWDGYNGIFAVPGSGHVQEVTHWMPLPKPPVKSNAQAHRQARRRRDCPSAAPC